MGHTLFSWLTDNPEIIRLGTIILFIDVILDVAVDVREGSPTFGKYVAVELSDENKRQLFIPQGFAHGFHVLSDEAIFTYKVDNPYTPTHERGIRYDDPTVHVDWSITDPESINLSEKDTKAPLLKDAELNFKY